MVIDYLRRRFPGAGNGESLVFDVCFPCEPLCPFNAVLPADRDFCLSHPQSNIVSNIALGAFCVEMDLYVTMQWSNALPWYTVQKYARQATKAKERGGGCSQGGTTAEGTLSGFGPSKGAFL